MSKALEVRKLNKFFGKKQVLHDVSFDIEEGEILGFIGPNGAGKTTTIKLILGLQSISSGEVYIDGYNIKKDFSKAIASVGAIVESPDLYMYLTGRQNLKLMSSYYNGISKEDIEEVIKLVGLENRIDDKVSKYSLGMRQRLGIAIALLSNPEFIMLDEPMNGLDPEGIVGIRNLIINLNQTKGITFLISSHILSELSLVATKYGIISHGVMLKEITKEELNESVKPEIIIDVDDVDKAYDILSSKYEAIKLKNSVKIIGKYELNEILKLIQDNGLLIMGVNQKEGNIEDYYLSIIGGNKHD